MRGGGGHKGECDCIAGKQLMEYPGPGGDVVVPDGVNVIGPGGGMGFSDCPGLTSVTFPASVIELNGMIFSGSNNLANLTAITITDANGGESNYFKLRDLGRALGFNVGYSDARGIFIETNKPYTDAD